MKLKTLLGLLLVAGLLAASTYYSLTRDASKNGSRKMGELLFDALPLEKISRIIVTSNKDITTLKKNDTVWVLEKRYGYLADFSLITDLVMRLSQARISRSFPVSAEAITRLGLSEPDPMAGNNESDGIKIEIFDAVGQLLGHVILGKTREIAMGEGEGSYLMLPGGKSIFLVNRNFYKVGKTYFDWMRKDILNINRSQVAKIACYDAESTPVYTVVSPSRGQWPALMDRKPEETGALNKSRLDDLITVMSPLTIEDLAGKAGHFPGFENKSGPWFLYTLFDGTAIKIIPRLQVVKNSPPLHLMKVEILSLPAAPESIAPNDPIIDRIDQWIYKIPVWKYQRFIPRREMLFEAS